MNTRSIKTDQSVCNSGFSNRQMPFQLQSLEDRPLRQPARPSFSTLAMAHLSHYAVECTVHLSYDQFTGLTRFLSDPDNKGHAFGGIQKAFMGLHVDNMSFAQPVSLYGMPVAGEIEDTFTNVLQAAKRLGAIDKNMFQIYSLEALHAARAVDLRRMLKTKDLKLGEGTNAFYEAYRAVVPYVKSDRIFTDDIRKGADFLQRYPL